MPARPDEPFRRFAWATFGRRESFAELSRKCAEQAGRVPLLARLPLVSIVIPFSRPIARESDLVECLRSLTLQSYPQWEAIVVAPREYAFVEAIVAQAGDGRIRFVDAGDVTGLAELKNVGASSAQGAWIGLAEPDAVLSPAALFLLVSELLARPDTGLIYSSHAEVSSEGTTLIALYPKPEPSWLDLVHLNYVQRFWLARRELVDRFDAGYGDAHEHDFLLRVTETTRAIAALPCYLYYRRHGSKREADPEGSRRAVEAHLARRGFPATVSLRDGKVKVTPALDDPASHLVSAILCFRDNAAMTLRAAEALLRQRGKAPLELIFVDNQSRPEEAARVQGKLHSLGCPAKLVTYDASFNFAEMNNRVIRSHARGRHLLLLNNDVFWRGEGALDELVAWSAQPRIGTVGITLRYGDGRLQHGGMRARFGGAGRLFRIAPEQHETWLTAETREVFANTFASCLVRREVFDEIGGLRPLDLANGFGDVAFGLECVRRGIANLIIGDIEAVHLESASRGSAFEYWEECLVEREYPELVGRLVRADLRVDTPGSVEPSFRDFAKAKLRGAAPWLASARPGARELVRGLLAYGKGFYRRGERLGEESPT